MKKQKDLVLDIGCGRKKHHGAIGVDCVKLPGVDVVCDIQKGLPFGDGAAKKIYAFHVLEHCQDIVFMMKEIERVLQYGGELEGEVPYHTSHYNFADPTHKNRFNWYTLDYFCKGHEFNYYAKTNFEMVEKKYFTVCSKFGWIKRAISSFATRHPNFYEKTLNFILKCDGIYFKMRKVR